MHAYRDALRDPSGQAVVRYAALIYPGPEQREGLQARLQADLGLRLEEALKTQASA